MATETGYAVLARELNAAGMETLFGVMGEANLDLVACLVEHHRTRYIRARHEAGAVSMAEGFAHASGKIGFATVTCGPGVTNAMTPLITAVRSQAAVLLITGQLPLEAWSRSQTIDQRALIEPTGATILQVSTPSELPGAVARAVQLIRDRRRPTVLNVFMPVLEGPCDSPAAAPYDECADRRETSPADEADLKSFAAALGNAQRPIILAGRGAVQSGAGPVLENLAQTLGAGLATTLLANGLFAGRARDLGVVGGLSSTATQAALARADVVAVFGASLNGWTTRAGSLCPGALVLHCDCDATAFARATVTPAAALRGDAVEVGTRLQVMLGARTRRCNCNAPLWWTQDAPLPEDVSDNGARQISPRLLCRVLDDALPADRTLTVDGGHFLEFPCRYMSVPDERGFIFTLAFGSVGLGLATAIGAAVGRPDRLSIGVVGDGGLMMSLTEIETAARHRIPLLLLVINDGGYGAEVKHLADRGWNPELAQFENPDIAAVAEVLGAKAFTIGSADELARILPEFRRIEGPVVLEAKVDPAVRAEWMSIMHSARRQ